MSIAKKIKNSMKKTSWIRQMFEQGARLKAEHGAHKVCDFSLGNPSLEPPAQFKKALIEVAQSQDYGLHSYMPNPGYPFVRKAVAEYLTREQGVELSENHVIMTCGAAGAINVVLKAILDPKDEVICPSPYFVEYNFYIDNHRGRTVTVPTNPDFTLNIEAIASSITPETKAILINSPNNPTGQIYSKESLDKLGDLLKKESKKLNKTIYLLSDEPYRKIVYDGLEVPGIFQSYKNSIICTSYSKDLSIPGERIGFLAVHPEASHKKDLIAAMSMTNRILGFVNAPAFMQRVIMSVQGASVDVSIYKKKRDILYESLIDSGYSVIKPGGAFYLFPKSPIPDDVQFVKDLQEELVLTVPGSGFGCPGHFRITYCVDETVINNALPRFKKVMEKYK